MQFAYTFRNALKIYCNLINLKIMNGLNLNVICRFKFMWPIVNAMCISIGILQKCSQNFN